MGTKIVVIGVGTQGSMIAFRNALHGKTVVGYSRTEASVQTCKNKIEKWLAYFIHELHHCNFLPEIPQNLVFLDCFFQKLNGILHK